MEEEKGTMDPGSRKNRDEIFSKTVRAGKRTYFFDVKETRDNENYLTITESKKRYNKDGRYFYEKHKIFLYKEDFDNFVETLNEVLGFIKQNQPIEEEVGATPVQPVDEVKVDVEAESKPYTDIEFEDLEKYSVAEESNR